MNNRVIEKFVECQEHAKSKDGICLATEYLNNRVKMLWQCTAKHNFLMTWSDVTVGHWCPECARISKSSNIEECHNFAKIQHNGKCLESVYVNSYTNMLWECEKGHQWLAWWNNIKNQHQWCPECCKIPITVCQNYAKSKLGNLLTTTYKNSKTKMLWECKEKHRWETSWSSMSHNSTWCPICVGNNITTEIDVCKIYAKSKNGKLLSEIYTNNKSDMLWECEKGHQWAACWHNIRSRNSWCPKCASFKTEYKCKELLEIKLGLEFIKTRFYYDINNKRKFYEFDGYNKEHKVAFEYHGEQHYIYPNYWHKTLKIYEKAIKRDSDKVKYAEENNIKLIIIPYTENDRLEEYVKELL